MKLNLDFSNDKDYSPSPGTSVTLILLSDTGTGAADALLKFDLVSVGAKRFVLFYIWKQNLNVSDWIK